MPDLYPTPTRLALLREVADASHGVWQDSGGDSFVRTGPKVTARVRELADAGWIETHRPTIPGHITYWRLTDAGRAVLDANPERER